MPYANSNVIGAATTNADLADALDDLAEKRAGNQHEYDVLNEAAARIRERGDDDDEEN